MAFEDSHTLFVVTWLRKINLEHLIDKWYSYRNELFEEKKRHPKRVVYSRLYEFCDSIVDQLESGVEKLYLAYEDTLCEIEVEEKLQVEI